MLIEADAQLRRQSYYETSVQRGPPLQEAVQADVLVVGAGFAGLSAALKLAERGLWVMVLDAGQVCGGASGRNGGQAIVGYASGWHLSNSNSAKRRRARPGPCRLKPST